MLRVVMWQHVVLFVLGYTEERLSVHVLASAVDDDLSWSRNLVHLVEPKGSLPCSQESTTWPSHELINSCLTF